MKNHSRKLLGFSKKFLKKCKKSLVCLLLYVEDVKLNIEDASTYSKRHTKSITLN